MAGIKMYTADFETTTIETCKDETWVWAWGTHEIGIDGSFKGGTDINDFMKWCTSRESKKLYFHNLKFDGFFIIDWLLKNGYEHNATSEMAEGTFQTVITADGLFYEINICYKQRSRSFLKCTIQDSLKKLPFPVSRIAKAFNLPILKGDIDYNKVRPRGYQPTEDEWAYLRNDVEIMSMALKIQFEEGLTKMTIGSDSLDKFKKSIGKEGFKRMFPVLTDEEDAEIRKSYKGGFTYVNPQHANKMMGNGQVYDVNSLYPSVMYYSDLPCGEPIQFEGEYVHDDDYPLYIQKLKCDFVLKEGHVPSIQIKKHPNFKGNEYLVSSEGHEPELYLTSVDLQLFKDHYDLIGVEYTGGFMFRKFNGQDVFKTYIDHYMEIKKNSVGAKRELAKLLLNNLYGKFATSTDAYMKLPYLEDGKVKLYRQTPERDKVEPKKSIYTPVGSFITSYAREITIRSAQALGDDFIYADTDSLHIRGSKAPDIKIDPKALGAWKHEGDFTRAKFIRAKTYIEDICLDENNHECSIDKMQTTKTKVTCAGMNDKIKKKVTFDNFNLGQGFTGKLVPKVIKGGVVLVEDDFTIKVK